MAKVIFKSSYPILLQAQPEKKFNKDGKETVIPARSATKATVMIAEYEETVQQFILPETFNPKDFGINQLQEGDVLTIRCPDLEKIKPFNIFNVDRVTQKGK